VHWLQKVSAVRKLDPQRRPMSKGGRTAGGNGQIFHCRFDHRHGGHSRASMASP
jgi:hypothetical protein